MYIFYKIVDVYTTYYYILHHTGPLIKHVKVFVVNYEEICCVIKKSTLHCIATKMKMQLLQADNKRYHDEAYQLN